MPAYFSINFQYKKSDIRNVKEVYENLLKCGMKFESGYYESEKDSWDEIILWNQSKFEDDFELGYTENVSHDYKQMLFEFHDFSEARFFILNIHGSDVIGFQLIIPEDDLVEYTLKYDTIRLVEKMKLLEQLAIDMWKQGKICCIQTGWECSDCPSSIIEIEKGIEPLVEPFAIVPTFLYREKWDCTRTEIDGEGSFLYNDEHWYMI